MYFFNKGLLDRRSPVVTLITFSRIRKPTPSSHGFVLQARLEQTRPTVTLHRKGKACSKQAFYWQPLLATSGYAAALFYFFLGQFQLKWFGWIRIDSWMDSVLVNNCSAKGTVSLFGFSCVNDERLRSFFYSGCECLGLFNVSFITPVLNNISSYCLQNIRINACKKCAWGA